MSFLSMVGKVGTNIGKTVKKAVKDTGKAVTKAAADTGKETVRFAKSDLGKGILIAGAAAVTGGIIAPAVISAGQKLLTRRAKSTPEPVALIESGEVKPVAVLKAAEQPVQPEEQTTMLNANRDRVRTMETSGGGGGGGGGGGASLEAAPTRRAQVSASTEGFDFKKYLPLVLILVAVLAFVLMSRGRKGE